MRPMLAEDYDPAKLTLPMFASPKIDGIRGLVQQGSLLSRSLKLIPNNHVQMALSLDFLEGFDGELVAGSEHAPNCMQASTSFFMARDKVSIDWTYWVFDLHDEDMPYDLRLHALQSRFKKTNFGLNIRLLPQTLVKTEAELVAFEEECLTLGFEGVILRKIDGRYKFGRSTVNEALLLKVKRFVDGEYMVTGFVEQMENTNEKQTNELGRSKRSTAKAGLVGKGTLGAYVGRDLSSDVVFNIGTGINDKDRQWAWDNRNDLFGQIRKYKSFPVGVLNAPRHPVDCGPRNPIDMS